MARIEGFRVKNYRALHDITLGRLWNLQREAPLTAMTVVIGKNGVGKSTLFDAFGFLADCLKLGVEEACDANGRGGFDKIRSLGQVGPIEFEVYYKEDGNARPITYEFAINQDKEGRPHILTERLRQRRKGQKHGRPFSFLYLTQGKGLVWTGEESWANDDLEEILSQTQGIDVRSKQEDPNSIPIELTDTRHLGIITLGKLKEHPRISRFIQFLSGWYLSYFSPDAARTIPLAGPQKRLNRHGDNLGNVVQFMYRDHKSRFKRILENISSKIPGIEKITPYKEEVSGNLYLLFEDKGFSKPLTHLQMSDGTLKVFAYLLLLEDPDPPPFLCIEEPENGLYHKLLEVLVQEFREHADRKGGSQLFITTHQPYFVDALNPDEVWVLEKGDDGFSKITRANQFDYVQSMVTEGQPLGALWYSDYLNTR
ncbi:MAG: AAA family ATPase [Nitrospirae bacterium]|nr:AAA family ATPase [Magnetococcales bacterium]HAT50954.1 ATPase [Alphaproteobacteria bacterium]